MTRDSGSGSQGENSRSEVEGVAPQSGAAKAAHRPNDTPNPKIEAQAREMLRLKDLLAKAPALPWIIGEAHEVRSHSGSGTTWFGSLADVAANQLAVEAVNALPELLAAIERLPLPSVEIRREALEELDGIEFLEREELLADLENEMHDCMASGHRRAADAMHRAIRALSPSKEEGRL